MATTFRERARSVAPINALLIAVCAALLALGATPPPAAEASVASTYKGGGVVYGSPTTTVPAYRWTGTTWIATSVRGGMPVYIHPFSGSWMWMWTQSTDWLAIQSYYLNYQAMTSYATPIWHADADVRGMDAWHAQEEAYADRLDVVYDPTGRYGKVYRALMRPGDLYGGKARAEMYGSDLPNGSERKLYAGDDLYFGWKSLVNTGFYAPSGNANAGNLLQMKGDSTCGGPTIGLTIKYGKVALRSELYGTIWSGVPMTQFAGAWHDLVLHIRFSKSAQEGFVEMWYDGRPVVLDNGSTRRYLPTMCPNDAHVRWKMGIYRDTGIPTTDQHWIENPRFGTSYASAAPR